MLFIESLRGGSNPPSTAKYSYIYQVKRKDGTTYFTTDNPNKNLFMTIKDWIKDKWYWLKTFNKPPTVTINQDIVAYEGEGPAVFSNGRVVLNINGDITLKAKKSPKYTGS